MPTFVRTEKCDGCKGQDKTACMYICPHNLMKLDKDVTGMRNWGIWSYIVKNSSVGPKILPTWETMMDVPDIQLARHADKINMYLITPSITFGDMETSVSSVVTEKDVKGKMSGGRRR